MKVAKKFVFLKGQCHEIVEFFVDQKPLPRMNRDNWEKCVSALTKLIRKNIKTDDKVTEQKN